MRISLPRFSDDFGRRTRLARIPSGCFWEHDGVEKVAVYRADVGVLALSTYRRLAGSAPDQRTYAGFCAGVNGHSWKSYGQDKITYGTHHASFMGEPTIRVCLLQHSSYRHPKPIHLGISPLEVELAGQSITYKGVVSSAFSN